MHCIKLSIIPATTKDIFVQNILFVTSSCIIGMIQQEERQLQMQSQNCFHLNVTSNIAYQTKYYVDYGRYPSTTIARMSYLENLLLIAICVRPATKSKQSALVAFLKPFSATLEVTRKWDQNPTTTPTNFLSPFF